jgi:hypothetical protein
VEVFALASSVRSTTVNQHKAFLPLAALLAVLALGAGMNAPTLAKPAPAAEPACCCDDPTCPPGCNLNCPPDCLGSTSQKTPSKTDCPPCPF